MTAPAGQSQIRREMDSLNHDWELYSTKLKDTQSGLEATKESWQEFDSMFDSLSKWVKDVELQLKDQELKSTLADKRSQVEKFKVTNSWIHTGDHLSDIGCIMAAHCFSLLC